MKGRMSIKARITLWYAFVFVVVCVSMMALMFAVSDWAAQTYCEDTRRSAAVVLIDEMEVEHGILEIDSDLEDVPNIYASLYAQDGELIYGRDRVDAPFEDGVVREIHMQTDDWYIYDQMLHFPDRDSVWLRLCMSANVHQGALQAMLRVWAWLLPLLSAAALAVGYLITAHAFRPVKEMASLAASIAGGGDLSGRVSSVGENGKDELHTLADTLNAMLERLQQAFRHERQFTSDAAHELRTPLNAIRIQGEYALSREDAAEKDEAIARMLDKSEEMHTLVDQLLLIARMDAGQINLSQRCRLDDMLEEIAQEMEPVAEERNMRIETALAPCSVMGNRAMLTRAVVNLVDNAIRYGCEGSVVRMGLVQEDGVCVLSVENEGDAIPAQDLPHVFERFWRGDSARSSQGTGIGLAIVQAAAKAHGGEAQAFSEAGKGSCFAIRLPHSGTDAPQEAE